jgi:hypothetical protein
MELQSEMRFVERDGTIEIGNRQVDGSDTGRRIDYRVSFSAARALVSAFFMP